MMANSDNGGSPVFDKMDFDDDMEGDAFEIRTDVYLNINMATFSPPLEKWYNLKTSRKVTNKPSATITKLRVGADKWEIIAEFVRINDLPLDLLSEEEQRLLAPAMSALPEPQLRTFQFAGVRALATVVRVIDGDTFEAQVDIPGKELVRVGSIKCSSEFVMQVSMKIRCLGYDSAEKDTLAGQAVKDYFIQHLKELGDKVNVQLFGSDKYGRVLANLYAPETNACINSTICHYVDPKLGITALPYAGKTKSEKFRQLTKAGQAVTKENLE